MFLGKELQELLGTDPRPTREQSLEMIFAKPDMCSHHCQVRLLMRIGVEEKDGFFDASIIRGELMEMGHVLIVLILDGFTTRILRFLLISKAVKKVTIRQGPDGKTRMTKYRPTGQQLP